MSENMNLTYLCGIVLVLEKLNVHMRYETIFFYNKKSMINIFLNAIENFVTKFFILSQLVTLKF